jgi:hypothetical protein
MVSQQQLASYSDVHETSSYGEKTYGILSTEKKIEYQLMAGYLKD